MAKNGNPGFAGDGGKPHLLKPTRSQTPLSLMP